jgi:hypothetical protein
MAESNYGQQVSLGNYRTLAPLIDLSKFGLSLMNLIVLAREDLIFILWSEKRFCYWDF